MLTVTEKAAEAIRGVLATADEDVTGLRVMVMPGGCSGQSYRVGLDTTADEDDLVIDCWGFRLFIDRESGAKLDDVRMDYVEREGTCGFTFASPKSARGCAGCRSGCA